MINRLTKYIELAAGRFGPPTPGWAIDKVLADRPHGAETIAPSGSDKITVHVTTSAALNAHQRVYQIAHEAIHCLIASGRRDTVYFEEGLANDFAFTFPELPNKIRSENLKTLPAIFKPPLDAFRALRAKDQDIAALREKMPI